MTPLKNKQKSPFLELERILTKSFTSNRQKMQKEKMFRLFFLPHNESGQLIGKSDSLK